MCSYVKDRVVVFKWVIYVLGKREADFFHAGYASRGHSHFPVLFVDIHTHDMFKIFDSRFDIF